MRARPHRMLRPRRDHAGPRPQLGHCLDNERKAVGQVIARTAVELHPFSTLAGDNSEAVMLDFVQPPLARRRFSGGCGKAGPDKTSRKGRTRRRTQQHTRPVKFEETAKRKGALDCRRSTAPGRKGGIKCLAHPAKRNQCRRPGPQLQPNHNRASVPLIYA